MRLTTTIIVCKLDKENKSVSLLVKKQGDLYALLEKPVEDNETISEASSTLLYQSVGNLPDSMMSAGLIDAIGRDTDEREFTSVSIVTFTQDDKLELADDIVTLRVNDIMDTKWIKDHEAILKATLLNLIASQDKK